MNDTDWIEMQRKERQTIMSVLDQIDNEIKKLIKKIECEPMIDAGYKRKLEVMDKLYSRRLSVIDKRLQNLGNKAELEAALEKIKQEVEEIVRAEQRSVTVGTVKQGKKKASNSSNR